MIQKSGNLQLNKDKDNKCNDDIILIMQFFIHKDPSRQKEILFCLKKNVENKHIDKIYLLNERMYTDEELGVKNDKIHQINIVHRLKYKHIYDFVEQHNINGYIVYGNSDIFLDNSIENIRYTDIHKNKKFLALLRYNYVKTIKTNGYLKDYGKIFGPRPDSQDVWIYHSNFNLDEQYRQVTDFNFGVPGCDNKIAFLMKDYGFELFNCPSLIKTFHVHKTEIRDYNRKDTIPPPYLFIEPYL